MRDPLGELTAFHREVERRLEVVAGLLADLRAGDLDRRRAALGAIAGVVAFFDVEVPSHCALEERSLFSRVLGRLADGDPARRELVALVEEHREANEAWAGLREGLRRLERDATAAAVDGVAARLWALEVIHRPHMRVEEEVIFPLAARALTRKELVDLTVELDRRRAPPPLVRVA